jgi:uncharacterized membrane protein
MQSFRLMTAAMIAAAVATITGSVAPAQQPPSAQAAAQKLMTVSMTMDCRVGEMDAAQKSVHCLVAKSMWTK